MRAGAGVRVHRPGSGWYRPPTHGLCWLCIADAVVAYASGPVIKKYLGVLAAADVYTASATFAIFDSIRLGLG